MIKSFNKVKIEGNFFFESILLNAFLWAQGQEEEARLSRWCSSHWGQKSTEEEWQAPRPGREKWTASFSGDMVLDAASPEASPKCSEATNKFSKAASQIHDQHTKISYILYTSNEQSTIEIKNQFHLQ